MSRKLEITLNSKIKDLAGTQQKRILFIICFTIETKQIEARTVD